MTLLELKNDILKSTLKSMYIITGEEIGIINIYLKQMSRVKYGNNATLVRMETVSDVWDKIKVTGMFANEPTFYVVRGDKDFQKAENSWETVKSGLGDNTLILLYDKIDSRLKFGKHFSDITINVEPLDLPVIVKYITKEINLSDKNAEELATMCKLHYDICMMECDKIAAYIKSMDNKISPDECFKKLVADGTIYQSQDTDVFRFSTAVCNRDVKLSYDICNQLIENNISSITILGTLYSSMRSVMLIQSCNGKDIANITGLDNGSIWYNKKLVGKYSISELVNAIKIISTTIENIKNGVIEDSLSVSYVLALIL